MEKTPHFIPWVYKSVCYSVTPWLHLIFFSIIPLLGIVSYRKNLHSKLCISSYSNMENQAQWRKSEQPLPAFRLETSHGKASRKNLVGRWLYQARSGVHGRQLAQELAPSSASVSAPRLKEALGQSSAQKMNPDNHPLCIWYLIVCKSFVSFGPHNDRVTIVIWKTRNTVCYR